MRVCVYVSLLKRSLLVFNGQYFFFPKVETVTTDERTNERKNKLSGQGDCLFFS